jgi:phosphoglycolate phosphatase
MIPKSSDSTKSSRPQILKSSTSKFRLVVFDLDGTLVDSRRDLAESANQLLEQCGGAPLPEESIGRMVGDGAATLVARVFAASTVPQPADALPRFLAMYNSRLLRFTRPYARIPELLDGLQWRVTLAVLSNKPLQATRSILEGLHLSGYFDDRVLGGDGPFPRKPDPAGLHHLIATAGVAPSNTVLVGDSVIDWRTAHAASAISCVARYGFGYDGFPTDLLQTHDLLIDNPDQLPALL